MILDKTLAASLGMLLLPMVQIKYLFSAQTIALVTLSPLWVIGRRIAYNMEELEAYLIQNHHYPKPEIQD